MGRENESTFFLGSYTKENEENAIKLKQEALSKNNSEK